MTDRWLNLFFRFSGYVFGLKQKIAKSDKAIKVLPEAALLIVLEVSFALLSLPMYLLVSPQKVQENGLIFPDAIKEKSQIKTYIIRRKISLVTTLSAGSIFLFKLIFVGIVSLYLLGAQQLLAATQDWSFGSAADYNYDNAKINITGGLAQLKDLGSTVSGGTTNSGFDSGTTGWTYADWDQGGGEVNVAGSRVTSGGNLGAYIRINTPSGKDDEVGGYWRQSFITTAANPSASVNFDWQVTDYDSAPAPLAFKLYVFVDTGSGVPVIGQEVWSSGTIAGTSGWVSVSNLDVSSKLTGAGTYYLKVAVWVETPGSNSGPFTVGYDNVVLNWSKTTHVYDTSKPTITPTSSLNVGRAISWNSFTETATKNGGEIYYQLSGDNGVTWKYWDGGAWANAGVTNYNIASDINTNISSFATSSNQLNFKAFLSSNGTQQVILDNINIGYTEDLPPTVVDLAPAQNTQNGYVFVNYNIQDVESDPSSLVNYEYSLSGAFAGEQVVMVASTTDISHSGISGLSTSPAGSAHTFVWDARSQLGAVYNNSVYVRLRANDAIHNSAFVTSTAVTVDYVDPLVSNVVATEPLTTTTVQITYDLFDNTADNLFVDLQVSNDGGATWTVPVTSYSGAVGSGVSSGNGKIIYWNAGVDYFGHQQNNIQVRVKAKDKWQNQGGFVTSTNFSLDTLFPTALANADLKSQPNAGDTTVLIGGSFSEFNPSVNAFSVSVSDGVYSTTTIGDLDTATPSNQLTSVGTTLKGNDYISKVKISHTDKYGQSGDNENLSPSSSLKYVKPYTPSAPTLSNPVTTRLDLLVNPNINEVSGLEYAVYETSTGKYVQSDGTLGSLAVWQTLGTASGQWGNGLGVSGQIRITGLNSPVSQYVFKVKSRNISDGSHAVSSESSFSATAQISNTAPAITLDNYGQTTDGTDYVTISYTGTDGQGDISSVPTYQYSIDNANWFTMSPKSGVGGNGTSSLVFLPNGSNYNFIWDSNVDLPNTESNTTKIRLRPNDSLIDGSLVTSNAFSIDNKLPVISGITATQGMGTRVVTFSYVLTDGNNSFVDLEISSDGGVTWTVPTTTVSGAVGVGVTPGVGKTITWNVATDFNNQYNTNMIARIRARDSFGNQGVYVSSAVFTVDTHAPVISSISASQDTAAGTFTFHYDISEDVGNALIVLSISSNGGSTWIVSTSTALGSVGSVTPGVGKTITWVGSADFSGQEKDNMQIRLVANDQYNNNSNLSSGNFSLDTLSPRVTNVNASQSLGGTMVYVSYDLVDQNNSLVEIDISSDGGATWTVPTTSVSGDIGEGVSSGVGKSIIWNAKVNFFDQQNSLMRVRVRAKDIFYNQSVNTNSTNFSLDTLNPTVAVVADLQTQPLAGETGVLLGGAFYEINPSSNIFYTAINGESYGAGVVGTNDTATPSNQLTSVGTTLKGNDYISKVKISHTDKYGQSGDNENLSPSSSLKYVKPYTPSAPTVDNPAVGTVDVLVNKNVNEVSGLEYAIYEVSQNKFVQSNGTLGTNPVWQPLGVLIGQWGEFLEVNGKVHVHGLSNHSYLYQFEVKSRNTSDSAHAASSESALSAGASSANQSPVISINSVSQITDGNKYVIINYTGSDLESETSTLSKYEYSTDNSVWHTMSEKSGVGSSGIINLNFSYGGDTNIFAWDVNSDLPNFEDGTVYVRLQANDGNTSGNVAASSAFIVDTKNPTVGMLTANQMSGLHNVRIEYDLSDLNNSNIELNISSDSGSTWAVPSNMVSGDVGPNIFPDLGKSITWNALADFANQENSAMQVRVKATDSFGNQSVFVSSANFMVDTKIPSISNVSAVQNIGNNFVSISYDLVDASSATVGLSVSSDGGATWTVPVNTVNGSVGSGVTPGFSKSITWNAGVDFSQQQIANMRVRVSATDVYNNVGVPAESVNFGIDTKVPLITNVTAAQISGSSNFNFVYDLLDSDNVVVALDISSDGGSTWNVATSSLTGAFGLGVAPGFGKVISWNGDLDFDNHQNGGMKIRLRGTDIFNNTSINFESSVFSLDTLPPVVSVGANIISQPNAGDTSVSVGGSFVEVNPSSNIFAVGINGGDYSVSTVGQDNTSNPLDQSTTVGGVLTGSDYISKVKIVESDDFGNSTINENISPDINFKFVKPFTPDAPIINNPQNDSVDVIVGAHTGESDNVEYSVLEVSTNKYVQANGSLSGSSVWQTLGTGLNQWGNASGVKGKIVVSSLNSPVANYSFRVKSRNPSDTSHVSSSESNLSNVATITNIAPSITIISALQPSSTDYVVINYVGDDTQNDTNDLIGFEFSTNTINWHTMTEKSGVGSNGISDLVFSSTGTAYRFVWNLSIDLPNVELPTVYVRLQSTDGLINSNLAVSSALSVDTVGPVVSNLDISQTPGTKNILIDYDLADSSGNNMVVLQISSDGGATWTVPTTSVSGDIGDSVSSGVGKSIVWNAGLDFSNQENNTMKLRLLATDYYNNLGNFLTSNNFTLDSKAPTVSAVQVVQVSSSANVAIGYNLSDLTVSGNFVEVQISSDGGVTWSAPTTTLSGDSGVGQGVGSKVVTWNAIEDFAGHDQDNMKVRVRARDYFSNQSNFVESAEFSLDSKAPVINNVVATQVSNTDNILIKYDLLESAATATVYLEISNDAGFTWSVSTSSASGDLGNVAPGLNKTIIWNAGEDFVNQELNIMRVRLRARDVFGNLGDDFSSIDFSLDTKAPNGVLVLSRFASATSSVTLVWPAVGDSNFSHYEIWHGTNQNDVNNRTSSAFKWSISDDPVLANSLNISTVITNIPTSGDYFVKIFAIDIFGHKTESGSIKVFPLEAELIPLPTVVTSGGVGLQSPANINLIRPVLDSIVSVTKQTKMVISGLADPRVRIDLYDNNILVGRLASATDNNGLFGQSFVFGEGKHSLTVRAVDFFNNISNFSEAVNFVVVTKPPSTPVVVRPVNNSFITEATPVIIGVAQPFSTVEIVLENKSKLDAVVDENGSWQIAIPSTLSFSNGKRSLIVRSSDLAGNVSEDGVLNFTKVSAPTALPGTVKVSVPFVSQSVPPVSLIRINTEAVEVPGLPIPKIGEVAVPRNNIVGQIANLVTVVPANAAINDVISFSGTALPDQDVVVYIHSDQGLIYRTHTDNKGVWQINHLQSDVELSPGEHTIFAVGIDPEAKVKSRPSAVTIFIIKRNALVAMFQYLNLKTTVVSLAVLVAVGLWVYKIREKELLKA